MRFFGPLNWPVIDGPPLAPFTNVEICKQRERDRRKLKQSTAANAN